MDRKWFMCVNTFLVVCPMTLLVSFIGLVRNYGFGGQWFLRFISSWIITFPVAYLFALFMIPRARRLTEKFTRKGSNVEAKQRRKI